MTGRTFLLTFVCSMLLGVIAQVQGEVFRFVSTNEYTVNDGFDLRVSNTSGDISIRFQPGDKVVVETTKEIRADSRSEAEELEEELQSIVDAGPNAVEIETRHPRWRGGDDSFWERLFDIRKSGFGEVRYNITVPVSASVDIRSTSADINLIGLSGSLDIETTSGTIDIRDHTGYCAIRNTSGDLRLHRIQGQVDVNSTSADILVEDVNGDVEIRSTSGDSEIYWVVGDIFITKTSGDVSVEDCSGDIDINTSSGDIYLSQEEGNIFVSTSTGDVRVRSQLRNGNRYEIETVSGDISFEVPAELNGRVRLKSVSGSIDTDLALEVRDIGKHSLEGSIGSNGPTLELISTSGDISLLEF
jgi:DUF4097 and DUF4098 domain-containing protein YvlB